MLVVSRQGLEIARARRKDVAGSAKNKTTMTLQPLKIGKLAFRGSTHHWRLFLDLPCARVGEREKAESTGGR